MTQCHIDRLALDSAIGLRDLSDERQGPHAMQIILKDIHTALADTWRCPRMIVRPNPVVSVDDNYDALGYPRDGVARDARYTRYITDRLILRTQASAAIPSTLRSLALDPPEHLLIVAPGLSYRRDVIDRIHTGEPHQVDLWRLLRGRLDSHALAEMVRHVVDAVLPGAQHRLVPTVHPYTRDGKQIDVASGDEWIEIGECGIADPNLLARCGLNPDQHSGLAMGLGLDRILMLRKGISDIRLLRSEDPRVASQLLDLKPYRSVSKQPPVRRDLSLVVAAELTAEEIGDKVNESIPGARDCLEAIEIMAEVSYADVPASGRKRMGMLAHQKNILLRLTIRHPTRTLTSMEANALRNAVYRALHEGVRQEIALE
jgi:phenylalanyl-tRNA synthetase alpha chain